MTISGLMPVGAKRPYQVVTTSSGMPASAVVGTFGSVATRSVAITASARMRPALTRGMVAGTVEVTISTSPESMAFMAIAAPL